MIFYLTCSSPINTVMGHWADLSALMHLLPNNNKDIEWASPWTGVFVSSPIMHVGPSQYYYQDSWGGGGGRGGVTGVNLERVYEPVFQNLPHFAFEKNGPIHILGRPKC